MNLYSSNIRLHCHQAESSVKITLNTILKTLSQALENNKECEWDHIVDQIQYAMNTKTDKHGNSPFSLLFERNLSF